MNNEKNKQVQGKNETNSNAIEINAIKKKKNEINIQFKTIHINILYRRIHTADVFSIEL